MPADSPQNFPYTPDELTGNWSVTLPAEASIGELLVYATPIAPEPLPYLRWKCDESALPLLETNGTDHTLTTLNVGAILTFGQPTMRTDATGSAVSTGVTSGALDVDWEPAITTAGTDFTLAALMAYATAPGGGTPALLLYLEGIMLIELGHSGAGTHPPRVWLWNGSTYVQVYDFVSGAGPTGGDNFMALRVTSGGVWKAWWGDVSVSGTFGTFSIGSAWNLRCFINDAASMKFQEIHVWPVAATDADVEAVRLSLVGV